MAFESVDQAVAAPSQQVGRMRRAALHAGEAALHSDGPYTGAALRRCVRLFEAANEGQTLVGSAAAASPIACRPLAVPQPSPGRPWRR